MTHNKGITTSIGGVPLRVVPSTPTITIADLLAIEIEEFELAVQLGERADATLRLYRRTAKHVGARWGHLHPSEINTPDLRRAMANERRRGRWNVEAMMLSRVLGRAVERGLLHARPKVPRYAPKYREARLLPEEYPRVIATLYEMMLERGRGAYDPSACRALLLCLYTGCRLTEAQHLEWDRVLLDLRLIRCGYVKRKHQRYGLSDPAIELLRGTPRVSRWCFPSRRNLNKPCSRMHPAWRECSRRVGLQQHVTIHGLRHSWVTMAASHGSLEQVRVAIGHSSEYQTARYSHLAVADVMPLVDAVGAAIGGQRRR